MFSQKKISPSRVNSLRPSDPYIQILFVACAWPVSTDYLNQCRNIVIWIFQNKLQLNRYRNLYLFFNENAFENVQKMAAI